MGNKFNKEHVLGKYHGKSMQARTVLEDGGGVIGEEVDEDNRLWYVVRRNGQDSLEPALNARVAKRLSLQPNISRKTRVVLKPSK